MLAFSLGITLTAEEEAQTSGILESAERALLLTNDFYSWDREFEQSAFDNGNSVTFNAVNFIMKEDGISEKSALAKVKDMILAYESEFLDRKASLYYDVTKLSSSSRSWIESVGLAVAGNHYWSATCPRHNAWKSTPRQPAADQMSISDLVMMSKSPEISGNGHSSGSVPFRGVSAYSTHTFSQQNQIKSSENTKDQVDRSSGMIGGQIANGVGKPQPRITNGNSDKLNGKGQIHDLHSNRRIISDTDAPLQRPCTYIRGMPSKGFRSSLIECLNNWMFVGPRELEVITEIIDLLHSSSLILDDIQDNSPVRRGKPATHVIFGTSQAINSATFLYLQAIQAARTLPNSEAAMDIVTQELEQLFVGQAWDLYWSYNQIVPSENDYLSMIDQKTSGLFRMLVRLMFACSTAADAAHVTISNLGAFASKIGQFFQIRDDYMNITSSTYTQQKGFCEDFDEGKMSYLVVHCATHSPACRDQILGIFRQHMLSRAQGNSTGISGTTMSVECKKQILACMEETLTLNSTLELLIQLENEIEREIRTIEDDSGVKNWTLHLLLKTLTVKT